MVKVAEGNILESKAEVHLSPYGLKVSVRSILIAFCISGWILPTFFIALKSIKRQNATLLLIYFLEVLRHQQQRIND